MKGEVRSNEVGNWAVNVVLQCTFSGMYWIHANEKISNIFGKCKIPMRHKENVKVNGQSTGWLCNTYLQIMPSIRYCKVELYWLPLLGCKVYIKYVSQTTSSVGVVKLQPVNVAHASINKYSICDDGQGNYYWQDETRWDNIVASRQNL